jgi:hypothetical protein
MKQHEGGGGQGAYVHSLSPMQLSSAYSGPGFFLGKAVHRLRARGGQSQQQERGGMLLRTSMACRPSWWC